MHLTNDCFVLTPEKAIELVDENTIGKPHIFRAWLAHSTAVHLVKAQHRKQSNNLFARLHLLQGSLQARLGSCLSTNLPYCSLDSYDPAMTAASKTTTLP